MSDLIQTVAADLKYLSDLVDSWIDDDSLRRASTVLRRLVVHNDLQNAWKKAGFKHEPRIRAPTLQPFLSVIPLRNIKYATMGGAKPIQINTSVGLFNCDPPLTEDQYKQIDSAGAPVKLVGLREFMTATALVVSGQLVTRRIVINYVANKLGGAHFDSSRINGKYASVYKLLDEANRQKISLTVDGIVGTEKPMMYFELLSTCQILVRSSDVQMFITRST